MFLAKKPRPPIKRTTSMNEVKLDLNTTINPVEGGGGGGCGGAQPFDPHNPFVSPSQKTANGGQNQHKSTTLAAVGSVVSSRSGRRHSADFVGTTHFLTSCALCKRRLIPGHDIYMYRGDSAFCSLECRLQKMKEDERKEKWSVASKIEVVNTSTGSEGPTKGETVAAL